jgi:NTP pyrophosphatase (non-canonical NTP hydrolase)
MELNEYQKLVRSTAVYPKQNTPGGFEYTLFGATGELGEVSNKYKKVLRNEENVYAHREELMDEIMDSFWYHVQMLAELGYTLEEGARYNVHKLAKRAASGTLKKHDQAIINSDGQVPGVCIR